MIKVLLVDDHALFRSGVRAELEGRVDLVGEAGSVAEAVDCVAARSQPDVVLLDVHLPDGSGARGHPAGAGPEVPGAVASPTRPTTSSRSSAPARAAT